MSEPCDYCSVPTAGDVHARHDVPATAAAAPPNPLWPPNADGRVRLLHSAGCPVELMAEVLGCKPMYVRQRLARLGLTEGKGCVLSVDDQIRALHAAGLGYKDIQAVVGLRSPHSLTRAFRRLGLTPNGWNERARRQQRRRTRVQVRETTGHLNGGRSLNDLLKLTWRSRAAAAGWAELLDGPAGALRPPQVRLLTLLADLAERGRTEGLTADEIGHCLGLAGGKDFVWRMALPLVAAGVLAAGWGPKPVGRGGRAKLYRLADGVTRHLPSDRPSGIDMAVGWHRAEFEPRVERGRWAE